MSDGKHASVKLYWILCVILCTITFVEWFVFKHDEWRSNAMFMVPVLLGLSLAKFAMVCGWYMHLRYDNKILLKIFAFSLFLSILVFTITKLVL